jgi:hypothetical protein
MTSKYSFWQLLALVWAVLLAGGLTYYLIRSLKHRVVTVVGRFGTTMFSRDAQPIGYWGTFIFYSLILSLLLIVLFMGIHTLIKQTA